MGRLAGAPRGLSQSQEVNVTVRLSVIVPAYNEEDRVGNLIRLLQSNLEPLSDEHEIIVVDDGSQDATASRVNETGATLIAHQRNAGKAAAVQTGLAASKGTYVAVLDADLEYFPDDLIPMLDRAESEERSDGPPRSRSTAAVTWPGRTSAPVCPATCGYSKASNCPRGSPIGC